MYGEQRSGVILHIHRSFLFLHNKAQAENAGIIVVRTTNVLTVSAKGGRSTGPDLSKMNPALMRNGMGGGGGAMPPPKSFGRDRMLGKTVLVRKGPFKGLVGIVKDSTDTQARVELHSKSKLVTVPKELLVVKEYVPPCRCLLLLYANNSHSPVTGQTIDISRGKGGSRVPNGASAAPPSWSGGRTPMAAADSSRTPAWGGPSSARSKCQPVEITYHSYTNTPCSTRLGRSQWLSHPCLENGRISHFEPLRWKPHCLWRIRLTHPSLERRRTHTIRWQLRHE